MPVGVPAGWEIMGSAVVLPIRREAFGAEARTNPAGVRSSQTTPRNASCKSDSFAYDTPQAPRGRCNSRNVPAGAAA